ncbi:MAG: glycoside hydrolase family 2 protein, partial [Clostridia bacterium]|nr:glycoside hydrolase family 2 protein [Clostridia bacterium]
MRTVLSINSNWIFTKETLADLAVLPSGEQLSLPHSWNAIDGQDGGNDYYRGIAYYAKVISKSALPAADRYYLEINGANSSADVYLNGKNLAHHDGGYSTWRVDMTDSLEDENVIIIAVDNSANETVYPQMADFTFYGGLYRNVNIVCVNESHFDLEYYGGPGIAVTPTVNGKDAKIDVEVYVRNLKDGQKI